MTGDDEDNLIICQLAREGYRVPKVVARVNDPRNQEHFDLLGITQTVCATSNILGLVEHEVPEHGIVRLLELRKENLEIVELQVDRDSPAAGKRMAGLPLPDGARLISVMRNGRSELARGLDRAAAGRPGAGRPRARQGGRAPPGAPQALAVRRFASSGVISRTMIGTISSRPSHMRPIMTMVETSLNGSNDPSGPPMPKAGPTFASMLADDGDRVERAEREAGAGGVDREHALRRRRRCRCREG